MDFAREEYIYRRELERSVYESLEHDCPTPEHQALKNMVNESRDKSLLIDHVSKKETINIFSNMGKAAIRLHAKDKLGPLFLNSESQLFRFHGSLLVDYAQPPRDKFAELALKSLIGYGRTKERVKVSKQLSVPMVFARGRIVEGGYMVVSPAYTMNQYHDLSEEQQEAFGWASTTLLQAAGKTELIKTKLEPNVSPHRIAKIVTTS